MSSPMELSELLQEILQGNISKGFLPDPPSRTVKLFISSTRSDFEEERQMIREATSGGELSRICSRLGLDLLVLDAHPHLSSSAGTQMSKCSETSLTSRSASANGDKQISANLDTSISSADSSVDYIDPHAFQLQLKEIENCAKSSIATFFVCLIGNKYKPVTLPVALESELFRQIQVAASEAGLADASLLSTWYTEDSNFGHPARGKFCLRRSALNSSGGGVGSNLDSSEGVKHLQQDLEHLVQVMEYGNRVARAEGVEGLEPLLSAVHVQLNRAIEVSAAVATALNSSSSSNTSSGSSDRIVAFVRRIESAADAQQGSARPLNSSNSNHSLASAYFDVTPSCLSPAGGGGTGSGGASHDFISFGLRQLLEDLICGVKKENIHFFNIPWPSSLSSSENVLSLVAQNSSNETTTTTTSSNLRSLSASPASRRASAANAMSISSSLSLPQAYKESFARDFVQSIAANIESSASAASNFEYPAEIVREVHSHLCNVRTKLTLGVAQSLDTDFQPLLQVRRLVTTASTLDNVRSPGARHGPVVVVGGEGSGKSTLLSQVFTYSCQWLDSSPDAEVYRVVRSLGQSPSSTYASELLRSLCQQITLIYGFEMSTVNFELGSLSIWFQELIRMVETNGSDSNLVIILDDLQNLKSVQTSALLGWLPWSLPSNVQLICSVSSKSDALLSLLKSKISSEHFVSLNGLSSASLTSNMIASKLRDEKRTLSSVQWACVRGAVDRKFEASPEPFVSPLTVNLLCACVLTNWESSFEPSEDVKLPLEVVEIVHLVLRDIEARFGRALVSKVTSFLSWTRYGLREVELLELITAECSNSSGEVVESPSNIWLAVKDKLRPLLREFYLLGRRYLAWSHCSIAAAVRTKCLDSWGLRVWTVHTDLAHAFYAGFTESLRLDELRSRKDSSDILREMDELWHHLLHSGDHNKLKSCALFNVDFLMTAVKSASISYLRSILELVRGHLLDYEIELLYTMTKHSVSVVSLDPDQLATEILMWLRPQSSVLANLASGLPGTESQSPSTFASKLGALGTGDVLSRTLFLDKLLLDTRSWCDKLTKPYLIPTNSWLTLPLPSQLAVISCPWTSIARAVLTRDNQNVIACEGKFVRVFNLASRTVVSAFEGHRENITCLHLSDSGTYLATGSEDTSLNIWQIDQIEQMKFKLKHRLSHHIAGVLCVTFAKSEKLVISGSEMGAVVVASVRSGTLVKKLDTHRGMVTCIKVNDGDDIVATGSTDCSVVIWSLEDFSSLNVIYLPKPVYHMDISADSTFLMVACEDNRVHVRALTTGSDVHCLERTPNNSVVTQLKFAEDSCRAVVGTGDGKLYIYDVHSAKLSQTLGAHSDMITAILTMPADRFLATSGGSKIVLWNFSGKKVQEAPPLAAPGGNKENLVPTANSSKSNSSSSEAWKSQGYQQYSRQPSKRARRVENHREPITAIAVSRDGSLAVSGSKDSLVKIWTLSSGETHTTLTGHTGQITCVAFAPNGNFCVSGSEDTTVRVWGLTLGLIVSAYREHSSKLVSLAVSNDSKKILSVDTSNVHRLWVADTGVNLMIVQKPGASVTLHGNNVFAIGGKNENSVRFWSVYEPESERTVSHSDEITCYTVTYDGQNIITGSQDSSLKVWEVATGKITQVLVGHEAPVMAAGTAALSPTLVISGSQDCNAIIWDMTTGSEVLTLSGHTATVTQVKLTLDGSLAITGGEDNVLLVWSQSGQRLAILDVHHSFSLVANSLTSDQLLLRLVNNQIVPILQLHNNPAKDKTIELPVTPSGPGGLGGADDLKPFPAWRGIIPGVPKKAGLFGRSLKREQSFDSFYFDQMNRGVSVDDFRKIGALTGTPSGSREHLATTGIIWDGSSGTGSEGRSGGGGGSGGGNLLSRGPRMKIGPKSKMLKKQQSMFAFFPEHGPGLVSAGSTSSLVRPQCPFTMGSSTAGGSAQGGGYVRESPLVAEKKRSLQEQLLRKGPPSRSQSLEDPDQQPAAPSSGVSGVEKATSSSLVQATGSGRVVDAKDSATCAIS